MSNKTPIYENVYYAKVPNTEKQQQKEIKLLQETQEQVEDLVVILRDNVDIALEREHKISDLNVISQNLEKRASTFKFQANVVKRRELKKRRKTKLIYVGIISISIIVIIVLIILAFNININN
ncbi:synaptobrevin-like isoform 1-T2 [Cochliomyia hominivorax]